MRRAAAPEPEDLTGHGRGGVPGWLRTTAEVSWRLLVIAGAIYVAFLVLAKLRIVAIPLGLSVLIAGVLVPPANWLRSHRVPPALATAMVEVGALLALGALVWLAATTISGQFGQIGGVLSKGWNDILDWLRSTPIGSLLHVRGDGTGIVRNAIGGTGDVTGFVLTGAATALELGAMALLTLFFTFFMIKDGERLFELFLSQFERRKARTAHGAGVTAWRTLSRYFRGVALIALINALLKGLALWLIGVPLILTIMLVTFVGSFIPFVGPIVAAAVGALVALTDGGLVDALLVVLAGILIQQFEGHVLQPLIMGRVMRIHAIAVLAGVAAGTAIAGLPGAFFAVPAIATGTALYTHFRGDETEDAHRSEPDEGAEGSPTARVRTARWLRDRSPGSRGAR